VSFHFRVDPRWADLGIVGEWSNKGTTLVFVVVSTTVDNAEIVILDTNMDYVYTVGQPLTISWEAELWQKAKFIS
jgi:hypothetical protein